MIQKEFLQKYRRAELRLQALDGQLEVLRVKMEGTAAPSGGAGPVQATYLGSKLEALIEQYQEQERGMQAERQELCDTMRTVRLAISDVADPQLRSLLEYKYLFNQTWAWIAPWTPSLTTAPRRTSAS